MAQLRRLGSWAALTAGIAWFAKVGYIAAVGAYDEPLEGPLFLIGLLLPLLGAWALAARLADGTAGRVAIYLLTLLAHVLGTMALSAAGEAAVPSGAPFWLQGEAGILVMATLWVAVGAWLLRDIRQAPVVRGSGALGYGSG